MEKKAKKTVRGTLGVCPVHGVQHVSSPMSKKVEARYIKDLKKLGTRKVPGFAFVLLGQPTKNGIKLEGGNFVNEMSNTEIIVTIAQGLGVSPVSLMGMALDMKEMSGKFSVVDNK